MKKRKGFVANSSSSCFICEVCGEEMSGMDMWLTEAGMVECANEHVFCEGHKLGIGDMSPLRMRDILVSQIWREEDKVRFSAFTEEEARQFFESAEGSDYWSDYASGKVLPDECPICQFEHVTDEVAARYLMSVEGLTRSDLSAILKDNYKSFTEFKDKTK
jgi:hypothetical protein